MSGRMGLGIWLPFAARQIFPTGTGFVWAAEVGGRVVRFVRADTLGPDGAQMRFRFRDRVTVVDASGADIDRSAAGRLAAETIAQLPHALMRQAGATWKPVNDHKTTVDLPGPNGPVDVDVTVDDEGHITDLRLQRWNDSAKPPQYVLFGGTVSLRNRAEVIW